MYTVANIQRLYTQCVPRMRIWDARTHTHRHGKTCVGDLSACWCALHMRVCVLHMRVYVCVCVCVCICRLSRSLSQSWVTRSLPTARMSCEVADAH